MPPKRKQSGASRASRSASTAKHARRTKHDDDDDHHNNNNNNNNTSQTDSTNDNDDIPLVLAWKAVTAATTPEDRLARCLDAATVLTASSSSSTMDDALWETQSAEAWQSWWHTIVQHCCGNNLRTTATTTTIPTVVTPWQWRTAIHCATLLWSLAHPEAQALVRWGMEGTREATADGEDAKTLDDDDARRNNVVGTTIGLLYPHMPTRYRDWYVRLHGVTLEKESPPPSFLVSMIQHVLQLLQGEELLPSSRSVGAPHQSVRADVGDNDDDDSQGSDDLDDEANADGIGGYYEDEGVQGTDAPNYDSVTAMLSRKSGVEDTPHNNEEENSTKTARTTELWWLVHRALEFLTDVLAAGPTMVPHLRAYLESVHWTVRCRTAMRPRRRRNRAVDRDPRHALTQSLLDRVTLGLPSQTSAALVPLSDGPWNDHNGNGHGESSSSRSVYHARAAIWTKLCHRYHPETLASIVYAGASLLCAPPPGRAGTFKDALSSSSFLRQALGGLEDKELRQLLYKMRLVDDGEDDHTHNAPHTSRAFLLQVLEEHICVPPDPLEDLQSHPLYPTEKVLWDFSLVPPNQESLLVSPVLSLPKLQTRFVSFADYLCRNFELMRLESAFEIRADLVDVIRRVMPVVRQSQVLDDDNADTVLRTEFSGWARMALELTASPPLDIKRVDKPLLGQVHPSQVTAELSIDLAPCGDTIRREWDELGEHDNLFLVALDATKMSGQPAPLMQDVHQPYGANDTNTTRSDSRINAARRVSDEDDRTFPERYGVTLVRGCKIIQVRDKDGTILSDPSVVATPTGTIRIFRVLLDPTQFSIDKQSPSGTDIYNGFNLVVRRHGKSNNFRSVLDTIRGLMAGTGSINRVLPSWLQSVLLGHGDPSDASYQSDIVKQYAKETAGVANPDAYLDFGDTFLSRKHLEESFSEVVVYAETGSKNTDLTRFNYRLRRKESNGSETTIEAMAYPFPGSMKGNQIAFTKSQVAAIRAGLSPGLSVVVGPPGTGKTDVAVQIIASLYHSFPTQRTIVLAHSNAALNDIFQKVITRGDVDERYMVRLGAGEKNLQTTSSHDFTKQGRVSYSLSRRGLLLEQVQLMSEALGISGRAERGADGAPAYTCETAQYFYQQQVQPRIRKFEKQKKERSSKGNMNVAEYFPFTSYFKAEAKDVSCDFALSTFKTLEMIFSELAEYRPLELLHSQRQKSDYLIMKQARIVAMTCTHAAIARSHLMKLGFEYDNVVIEEAGQMLEIETFIPLLLQRGNAEGSTVSACRLKRVSMMGDHNQLPPVIQNMTFAKFSSLDQSLFSRMIRLQVPYIQLDKQGRSRPEIAKLYSWRYKSNLGNLDRVSTGEYALANAGFAHTFQFVNVENFEGKGEVSPTAHFFQNVGEAEYVVALFQYLVLIGYPPHRISILTTYNGQRALIKDVISQRCGRGTVLGGAEPLAVSTVDQYQGQQNDIILLSLVRTAHVGHLKDIRRLIVAVSRARLGIYVFGRQELFFHCHDLRHTLKHFSRKPNKLQLVTGEKYDTKRDSSTAVPKTDLYEVDDVEHMGSIVHQMQEELVKNQSS